MGFTDEEEKELIRRLKDDDEMAFRKIYLKFHKELHAVAGKYLRSKELAEDAVHDVFVKLWDNRGKLENSGSLSGYLFTALENHVINMINTRRRKLKKKAKLSSEKSEKKKASDHVMPFSEYKKYYEEAIEKLPKARREVFELRMKEGLTNQEVADIREISVNTVKSHFYKASKFIREYVSKHAKNDTGT